MAKYKCKICGYVFDEEKEGKSFEELDVCPVCKQPKDVMFLVDEGENTPQEEAPASAKTDTSSQDD